MNVGLNSHEVNAVVLTMIMTADNYPLHEYFVTLSNIKSVPADRM